MRSNSLFFLLILPPAGTTRNAFREDMTELRSVLARSQPFSRSSILSSSTCNSSVAIVSGAASSFSRMWWHGIGVARDPSDTGERDRDSHN